LAAWSGARLRRGRSIAHAALSTWVATAVLLYQAAVYSVLAPVVLGGVSLAHGIALGVVGARRAIARTTGWRRVLLVAGMLLGTALAVIAAWQIVVDASAEPDP
jgi:hypothetical protein